MTTEKHKTALMEGAWASFIQWAWGEPKMREAYETATLEKLFFSPGNRPIDRMIDAATGYAKDRDEQMVRFIDWVTIHHWGEADAPAVWRERRALQSQSKREAGDAIS
jgi:hypothetical protein